METKDLFRLAFSEEGGVRVQFLEDFLSLPLEKQIEAMEDFFWKKTWEPSPRQVNDAMTQHELTIILAESLLAKLKRGVRLDENSDIEISIGELMSANDLAFY